MFRSRIIPYAALTVAACCMRSAVLAQESSSKQDSQPQQAGLSVSELHPTPAPDAPSAALRDLLSAACAHDETTFAKFLTARNAQSFHRLTPTARVELMKRFVLLDGIGKSTATVNSSGRPTLRCSTADGAAELQLGGTELRDNMALLPLDIRDVSELRAGDPHHILMGMIREDSAWKVLSLGMLFLDLPSLEIEWDQSAISDNERQALAGIKLIAAATETYRKTYFHVPEAISKLGPSSKPSPDAAGLLDADLASGQSNGYIFRLVIVGANDLGAPAQYELSATPVTYGRTGKLSFFRDAKGIVHAADNNGAVGRSLDPVVN